MIKMMNGERNQRTVAPENLKGYLGEQIQIHGSVYKIRKMRGFAFVLLRTARQVIQCVYSEERAEFSLEELAEESCVRLTAEVVAEERSRAGYELHLLAVEVLSKPEEISPIVINNKLVDTSLENLLNYRPVTLRNEKERAIFKIQEGITFGIRKFLQENGFYGNPYAEDCVFRGRRRSKYIPYRVLRKGSLSRPESAVLQADDGGSV